MMTFTDASATVDARSPKSRSCGVLLALFAALGLVLTVPTTPAYAKASGGRTAKAKYHFKRAELFYQQGRFAKALHHYQKAQIYRPSSALVFNIAQCYRQLRNWKKALFFYRLYLSQEPNAVNYDEVAGRIKNLKDKLASLDKQPMGRVSIITDPPGARVYVDKFSGQPDLAATPGVVRIPAGQRLLVIRRAGFAAVQRTIQVEAGKLQTFNVMLKASRRGFALLQIKVPLVGAKVSVNNRYIGLGPLYKTIRVDPGQHRLRVEKAGYQEETRDVFLGPGATRNVEITLNIIPGAVDVKMKRRMKVWIPWTVFGVGVVIAAAGIYPIMKSVQLFQDFDDSVARGQEDPSLETAAIKQRSISYALFGVGGALLTAGAIMLVLNRPRVVKTEDDEDTKSSSRLKVVPWAGSAWGAALQGRF